MRQRSPNGGLVRYNITVQPYSNDPEEYAYHVTITKSVKKLYGIGWDNRSTHKTYHSLVDAQAVIGTYLGNYPQEEVTIAFKSDPWVYGVNGREVYVSATA